MKLKKLMIFLSSNNSKIDDFVHFSNIQNLKWTFEIFILAKLEGKENETLKLYSEIKNGISILRKELIN